MSKTATPHWEHFAHQADVGVRGVAPTLEAAFEQAALALTAVIADIASVAPAQEVSIDCEAPDPELLLADWLNRLIYEMATRRMLFSRFQVALENGRLHATAWGESVDPARHRPVVEIKGATYTELKVARDDNGLWIAQCVVDV